MATVNLYILDASHNKKYKMGIADNEKCESVLEGLIANLGLPKEDARGNTVLYSLVESKNEQPLSPIDTLAEAEVKEGDLLILQARTDFASQGKIDSKSPAVHYMVETVSSNAGKKKANSYATLGQIFGVLSVIFGFIMFNRYEGNAYDNTRILTNNIKFGFGFSLVAFGLFMICYFGIKNNSDK